MSRKTLLMAAVAIAMAAVMIAGCTGTSGHGKTLSGRDIFDPQKFGMAEYGVLSQDGSASGQGFLVIAHPGETDGDRLTSVVFSDNVSTRADVVITPNGRLSKSALITDIDHGSVVISGGSPTINMTTIDGTWNTLEDTYTFIRTANVTVPAGQYDGCSVYGANKTIYYDNDTVSMQVLYYIHPSSPVPVLYTITGATGQYSYGLLSVYAKGDMDSTPGRMIQTFFDDLDNNRLDSAFKYLVTYNAASGAFQSPDAATYQLFLDNMNRTYQFGSEGFRVQYVYETSMAQAASPAGYQSYLVGWTSLHYLPATLNAYRIDGSFYMVEQDGHWRIIV